MKTISPPPSARTLELSAIRTRRLAAELALAGIDYPYSYPGAPFLLSAFTVEGSA
ncbi:hypothetical protein [Streptomyces sp. NPDC058623]|uniref:hypothetical protein n=1 Tax=Streptomyces sp. NPDC058623 TaxID=3346563 RepID=UPI0036696196